jgi:hypothetical protein
VKFPPYNKAQLQQAGLTLFESENRCRIIKETGVPGNVLPGYKALPVICLDKKGDTINEIQSDCPSMPLFERKDHFELLCWDWVPGPGPGDFDKKFDDAGVLTAFILSYYFGVNEYFATRKVYEEEKRGKENFKKLNNDA